MKEPKMLRLTNPYMKSTNITVNGKTIKFTAQNNTAVVDADADLSNVNMRDFALMDLSDVELVKWYRSQKPVESIVEKELTEEDAVAFLKAKGYLAYKRGEK